MANTLRTLLCLKGKWMSVVWTFISFIYLLYLHGACVLFIVSIASLNYLLVKMLANLRYFSWVLWVFNMFFLLCNRVYEGYSFMSIGQHWAFLDNYRGNFRWHICFNFVFLRMISFGYDYHWEVQDSGFDRKDMARVTFHFVRGNQPEKFASAIVNLMSKCYPGEDDVSIAQAVLMYLSQKNIRDANKLIDEIKKKAEVEELDFPDSELVKFIMYLLQTLERDALPLLGNSAV